ncbi:MAG TPA: translocation/assembly module TamB domain-containing protein, partial [Verrucomicrobiae bacterium]|nr:translocation/assembly module TamB domain-containing protein [Verrucomicrobiae bacterium]
DGPLILQASTQTNSLLWQEIANAGGLRLVRPQLRVDIHGTWGEPQGRVNLRAQRIQFPQIKHALPTLEDIDLAAEANHDEAQISRLHFLLAGQPVEMTAQLPFQKHFWSTLMEQRRLPDWRNATAHLKIPNADLAPFAKLMPETLNPQGVMRADVTLQPGGVLKGELAVTNAATLPLATLGGVRDIRFAVNFAGKTADLTNFSASIGGETVTADGQMPLDVQELNGKGLPPFVIHLRGTNVPLVRKASLLLRADLALALTNPPSGPGIVAGGVTLRDSLFLASLQSLIPENTAAPAQHPPYFSVAAQPWAGWLLDLQVNGDQFLRVQTPFFHGKASATMKLQGTLGNPLALGEVKIASGAVTFPFGNLDVDQGFVSLTSDNPYHPRLFITAQAQQFGYNIKLEVTGAADAPIVQFSSSPPLSSEEIVLMLTTGQLPAGIGASTSTQQRAQGLAMFFGKNLLSEFGLGLGTENRLTVRSGQQISEAGRPTYEADYQISKR